MLPYTLTGLTPNTNYTFNVVASNINGTTTGNSVSFTTLAITPTSSAPTIVSATPTNITTTSVKLNGTVSPNGANTQAWFESSATGSQKLGLINLGNSTSGVLMLPYTLTGLTPNTNYTFNVVANNTNGTTTGNSVSFTTLAQPQTCAITNFTANQNSIILGSSSTLSWNTSNCTSASISPNIGSVSVNGSQTVYPIRSTTYTLTAQDANGISVSLTTFVSVNNQQPPVFCTINNFSANPTSIQSGSSSTLTWNTTNCSSVTISNLGYNVPTSGVQVIYPTVTTTYVLTATDASGQTQTQSQTVSVNNSQSNCYINNFNVTPTSIASGQSTYINWSTSNCISVNVSGSNFNSISLNNSGQTIYPTNSGNYTITAISSNGSYVAPQNVYVSVSNYQPYNYCTISYFNANPTSIQSGSSSTLTWNTTNCTSVTISNLGYNVPTSGVQVIYPRYTTTYTLTAYGINSGVQSQIVTVSVNNYIPVPTPIYYPPTPVYQNIPTPVYQTPSTRTITNTRTIVKQGTTVIGTESPIMLKIENRYQSIKVGDTVDYTVTYQNIGTKTLTHPVLQVVLPRGIAFLNSSRGTYQSDTYTLTVPLEDLVPNIVGTVYLEGRVDSIDNNNAQIVTTAILVYTTPKGAQENAMAYVLNSPTGGSSLVGAAIFGGGILPRTMLGWLFLFVIVLALVLIVRKLREDSLYQKSLQRVDANHIQNLPVH